MPEGLSIAIFVVMECPIRLCYDCDDGYFLFVFYYHGQKIIISFFLPRKKYFIKHWGLISDKKTCVRGTQRTSNTQAPILQSSIGLLCII